VANLAVEAFLSGEVDEVFVAYTDFINTLTQQPRVLRLLPLSPYETDDAVAAEFIKNAPKVTTGSMQYEFEPSPEAILDEIVPRFTQLTFYQSVLESKASEHSARMVAMRNASDNSDGLVIDLTLVYNKARQAAITSEILDIVGGAEALQATLDKAEAAALGEYQRQAMEHQRSGKSGGTTARGAASAPRATKPGKPDDLTRIEGIGPKMQAVLRAAGLDTFEKLASADEPTIREALTTGGIRLVPPTIQTWAEQARLAAAADWDALKALQDTLVAGRSASSD